MCGIAGILSVKPGRAPDRRVDLASLKEAIQAIQESRLSTLSEDASDHAERYLSGKARLGEIYRQVQAYKEDDLFYTIFSERNLQDDLFRLSDRLKSIVDDESQLLKDWMGRMTPDAVDAATANLELMRDISWCLSMEIRENVSRIRDLLYRSQAPLSVVTIFKRINAIFNSIDKLEVRGRDSAGVSVMFVLDPAEYDAFQDTLDKANFLEQFNLRLSRTLLINQGISVRKSDDGAGSRQVALCFTYKVAAEIGSLGDNVSFLRRAVKNDPIFQAAVNFTYRHFSVLSHTRWASVGAISEPNCHPVDQTTAGGGPEDIGIFHVCLNGDIDNYIELKSEAEKEGYRFHADVTTDTKIIPVQVARYVHSGMSVEEAFRAAVSRFEGSHAIAMHTDLAPGRLFLAQRGSGQAIFVGFAADHYMAASEIYGFIEETARFVKMDGEKTIDGQAGPTQGQIFILSQDSPGGLEGISARYYDGTPVSLTGEGVKGTAITSRDIDRQEFPHYFIKEISESPVSVEKTLQNRWRIIPDASGAEHYAVSLDETVVPASLRKALAADEIRRVFFVGQGTAGVAAQACADILRYYMDDAHLLIDSLKASELSGFQLLDTDAGMRDTLVVAISQSGTTTDTNRTVDMVRERGAHTLAIVNRRDSDITYKVDGVMYTSSGRDLEMSVASTKAFYSQIVAGAVLSLDLAHLRGRRDQVFVTHELRQLLTLPDHMRRVLGMREQIAASAGRLAVTRTYWAAVGSGPNKTSADEIRIKLSELCYKTISSDYVEDKKHIDLSSEPLIIVCAAGTRDTVLGDIIKDTAIFKAHKAIPVIIATEGESRFDPYAADVFHVPGVSEHLAPILNTLVGHIWGYYAALAINEGSRFFFDFREDVQSTLDSYVKSGTDIYELVLEKGFREKMARFYQAFRKKRMENGLPSVMGLNTVSDLTILLKYLSGRLPVTDFEMDFGIKGTVRNILDTLFECVGTAINNMARPVDAIKHQAKTVTVGTSRISEKIEGLLFDALSRYGFRISQLSPKNVLVLKNLQEILSDIQGVTVYRVAGLNLLGEPTENTTIEVIRREGTSQSIPSRVDRENRLKGTKRIIVQRGNVYIGKGRKDDRSILCIPLSAESLSGGNAVEHILLLHVSFRESVETAVKVRALGGKYDNIKNIVAENNIAWEDDYLDMIEIPELFGRSAEKIGEYIVSWVQ